MATEEGKSELESIIDRHSKKFFDALDVRLTNVLSSIKALQQQGTYKSQAFNLNVGDTSFFSNSVGASAILIVPQNGGDLTNLTVDTDSFGYTFPVGTTNPKLITLILPNGEVVFRNTGSAELRFKVYALTKQSAEIYSSLDVNSVTIANNPSVNILGQPISVTANNLVVGNSVAHVLIATALVAATSVAVWTPASTKKFQLLYASLSAVATAATSVALLDGTTQITESVQLAVGTVSHIEWVLPSNGILSSTANNVLNVQSPGTPTVSVLAIGLEV